MRVIYCTLRQDVNLLGFKVIPHYPDYNINNEGSIWSNKTCKFLRNRLSSSGYPFLDLSNENGKKSFTIHRLVSESFIHNDDPENKTHIDHIDTDKTNYHYTNLEFVTPQTNVHRAIANNLWNRSKKAA